MKTNITQFFFAILLGLIFVSCEGDVDYLETITAAKEVSVPDNARVNERFFIDLIVYGSSGCAEFSRFNTKQIGDTTYFELFQKRDKSLTCTDNIIEIHTTISMSFSESGAKYLKFNDTTIFSDFTPEIIKSIEIEM